VITILWSLTAPTSWHLLSRRNPTISPTTSSVSPCKGWATDNLREYENESCRHPYKIAGRWYATNFLTSHILYDIISCTVMAWLLLGFCLLNEGFPRADSWGNNGRF
jgi:hypothetical protein